MENEPIENAESVSSDKEIVDRLIEHITNPCKIEVDGTIHDIGDFYIREANKVLGTITDERQRIRLQKYIDIYDAK